MIIKKTTLYLALTLILIIVAGFFLLSKGSPAQNVTGNAGSGSVQKVVIGMKNLNYYPNTIKVNANQPVRISLDSSVTGCLRSFTIRDFGIAKYLKTPDDYVEFTPTKKGTFRFACSMGMGTGTLVVE
ncbi:cupredoxin domain-containing protein [Candidatus Pacearchaeota archaeon]|nr:cupredoxin domain-containing protein [Candidatus Pacearchaeota archaeon]